MRLKVLAIPTNAAADTQAATNLAEAKQILKDKVNDALAELAEMRIEVVNPVRASDTGDSDEEGSEGSDTAA